MERENKIEVPRLRITKYSEEIINELQLESKTNKIKDLLLYRFDILRNIELLSEVYFNSSEDIQNNIERIIISDAHFPLNLHVDTYGFYKFDSFEINVSNYSKIIETLDKRYQYIILLRYQNNKSFTEIGNTLGISKSRVGQIIERSKRMMRHPHKQKLLMKKVTYIQKPLSDEATDYLSFYANNDLITLNKLITENDLDIMLTLTKSLFDEFDNYFKSMSHNTVPFGFKKAAKMKTLIDDIQMIKKHNELNLKDKQKLEEILIATTMPSYEINDFFNYLICTYGSTASNQAINCIQNKK